MLVQKKHLWRTTLETGTKQIASEIFGSIPLLNTTSGQTSFLSAHTASRNDIRLVYRKPTFDCTAHFPAFVITLWHSFQWISRPGVNPVSSKLKSCPRPVIIYRDCMLLTCAKIVDNVWLLNDMFQISSTDREARRESRLLWQLITAKIQVLENLHLDKTSRFVSFCIMFLAKLWARVETADGST